MNSYLQSEFWAPFVQVDCASVVFQSNVEHILSEISRVQNPKITKLRRNLGAGNMTVTTMCKTVKNSRIRADMHTPTYGMANFDWILEVLKLQIAPQGYMMSLSLNRLQSNTRFNWESFTAIGSSVKL